MAELAIRAPGLWPRQGPAPTLTVTDDPARWVAVEIAITRDKLAAMTVPGGEAGWASWERGLLRRGPVTVPDDAWDTLKTADRLYYRAHSSAAPGAWVDHLVTVPDRSLALVPFIRICDRWLSGIANGLEERLADVLEAAAGHVDFPTIGEQGHLAALICLHRFSPKRPMDPSQLEWVVLLARESLAPREVRMLVQRLAYASLSVIAGHTYTDAGTLTPVLGQTGGAVPPNAAFWPREERGPFLIFRNNSPAPDEEGGTCVALSGTGRCAYVAKTKWRGMHEATIPP